jgi:pimeloyl-ACP methyl ester carboxylesterase
MSDSRSLGRDVGDGEALGRSRALYCLILVHGTRARRADWTQPERSALCKYLEHAFGDGVSFSSPEWSGKNTYQARVDGMRQVVGAVDDAIKAGRVPILVGHSHGGSVIAHALARDPDFCKKVGGAIFLATPFIHARPLPLGSHLPKGPALLAGLLCALVIVLGGVYVLAASGWPENEDRISNAAAFVLPFAGLLAWWATFRAVSRFLGAADGRISEQTRKRLDELIGQLDLTALEQRRVNRTALIIRSTADEAASGLAAAQLLGRIASDLPALVWRLPRSAREWLKNRLGLGGKEPPMWFVYGFLMLILAFTIGFAIRGAAWLSEWPALQALDAQIRDRSSAAFDTVFTVFVRVAVGVVLLLLATVPLVVAGIPLKLLGLWLYGLRGWPVLQALYVELSVEPAPPGEWRVHQLDAKLYETEVERARAKKLQADLAETLAGGEASADKAVRLAMASAEEGPPDTTLAHSYVYNDPRAHEAIKEWLEQLSPSRRTRSRLGD